MITRAELRGKRLDKDCYDAHRTSGEYGKEDERIFCYGLADKRNDELLEKCVECKAYVGNAEPLRKKNEQAVM